MTNNAQLLPLPEGSLICWTSNPEGPCDIVYTPEQMQSYALSCIEAAKPAQTCNYPDCTCPTENPCLKGLPADALGSLPVVATVCCDIEGCEIPILTDKGRALRETGNLFDMNLTDHAKATAEIAKRDAEIKNLNFYLELQGSGFKSLAERNAALFERILELQAKLAGVDGLVEALRKISDTTGNVYVGGLESVKIAREALDTYEAAQEPK